MENRENVEKQYLDVSIWTIATQNLKIFSEGRVSRFDEKKHNVNSHKYWEHIF